MVMNFNSHSAEIPSHLMRILALKGMLLLMHTFYLSLRILEGVVLALTLVLLAHVPLI